MKSSEICRTAIQAVNWQYGQITYRWYNDPETWADMRNNSMCWQNDAIWTADCLGFLKSMLCGFTGDKSALYGGGCDITRRCWTYPFNELAFLNSCTYHTDNFAELEQHPCSLLWKSGHVGLYVGDYTITIDGEERVCNACECTTSFGFGGRPSYIDSTGLRHKYKGSMETASYYDRWGIFNTDGIDYSLTEYDGGGSVGFAGIGAYLTQPEVIKYWDSIQVPDGEYLIELITRLYGVTKTVARICVGWAYGEGYQFYSPYMGYLCNCIPFNLIKGYGYTSGANLAYNLGGGDQSSFYSQTALRDRGITACTSDSELAQLARKSVLLACLNPNQRVRGCNGVDRPPQDAIIYSELINGYTINAYEDYFGGVHYYDVDGVGIRGGVPAPNPPARKGRNMWLYLKPWYKRTRFNIFRY